MITETTLKDLGKIGDLVSGMELTDAEILDYVLNHVDGFTYCQLQTGISKNELLKLLDAYGFEQCNNCVAWEKELHPFANKHLCSDCYEGEINRGRKLCLLVSQKDKRRIT